MKRIGERIKKKRDLLNMSLNELARQVGISPSALSQIENSKAFPSIITLKHIADCLHTSISDLLGENESLGNNPVMKKAEYKFIEKNESGTELFLLSHHDGQKLMDTYLVRLNQNSNLNKLFTNLTGQVFGYIIEGTINLLLNDKNYQLTKGDTFYFFCRNNFTITNADPSYSELLWIISPPNYL